MVALRARRPAARTRRQHQVRARRLDGGAALVGGRRAGGVVGCRRRRAVVATVIVVVAAVPRPEGDDGAVGEAGAFAEDGGRWGMVVSFGQAEGEWVEGEWAFGTYMLPLLLI